jgi:hypothetical protein
VRHVVAVRQLTNGGYLFEVSETELGLIKAALEQTERVSRFGIEVLEGAHKPKDGRRSENTRLRREIDGLAVREASLRSLHATIAAAAPGEEVA